MKIFRFTLFVLFSIVLVLPKSKAQNRRYNQWMDHLPFSSCISVAEANDLIYAATPFSLLIFNNTDNSLSRLNKVSPDGLTDVGISSIAYSSQQNTLVVAYSNTNIDLVKGSSVINIPDIKRKQILGNKTINSILVIDKYAYLACGFGIVVLDIEKEEIKDTYYIGPSGSQIDVKSLTFFKEENMFYAATEKGIYAASASSNMAYYVNWVKETNITGPNTNFNLIASFAGKVYANKTVYSWSQPDTMYVKNGNTWSYFMPNDHWPHVAMRVSGDHMLVCSYASVTSYNPDGTIAKVYESYKPDNIRPNDALLDKQSRLWIADNELGLWSIGNDLIGSNYPIDGPISPKVSAMAISGNQLWAVPGGRTSGFENLYNVPQFYTLASGKWSSFTKKNTPELEPFRDILCVAADPSNNNHAFLGSWGMGLLEIDNNQLKKIHNTSNSSLQYVVGFGEGTCRIGGVAFDDNNNLWVTNAGAANVLSMLKPSGEWKSYNLGDKGTAIDGTAGYPVLEKG